LTEAHVDKRDLLTIAVLSIVFFSVATWNLGMAQIPLTTWQATGNKSFYIDLGSLEGVSTVYFLIKTGSADVTVYIGSPGNWSYSRVLNITFSYYSWSKLDINRNTQYMRFDFQQASIEVAEMAVLSQNNQRIAINAVTSETASDPNLSKLVDEQGLVQCPPTYMSETYFDEIYFVRTAEQYLHLQISYEWTHPPLGKLIQASGILVFGYNPFGWRIMGVLFAMLMIPVMYFLGKKLFGTWIGAFASAFLLTFDFMHFTMGRMGTADTYVVFFSLLSQLFFLIYFVNVVKNGWKTSVLPLFLAVLFFALGFSAKWVVLYGFVGMLALLVALRIKDVAKLKESLANRYVAFFDYPFLLLLGFLAMAVFIYFLTYVPDMLAGRTLLDVINLQFAMYNYHSTLVATHPFSSQWWSWPLMVKPLFLFVSSLPNNINSVIVLLGNPAVWWVGFAFIILAVERALRGKDLAAIFITVIFFFQWIPYVLISRLTFIYHFYVNVPFLCLASAYFISRYWRYKWGKVATIAFFVSVVAMFGLFYPVISGAPAPTSFIDSLKWLKSWYF
jgi:dolichyl-phosphate-mannose-protein mannosyltransferase